MNQFLTWHSLIQNQTLNPVFQEVSCLEVPLRPSKDNANALISLWSAQRFAISRLFSCYALTIGNSHTKASRDKPREPKFLGQIIVDLLGLSQGAGEFPPASSVPLAKRGPRSNVSGALSCSMRLRIDKPVAPLTSIHASSADLAELLETLLNLDLQSKTESSSDNDEHNFLPSAPALQLAEAFANVYSLDMAETALHVALRLSSQFNAEFNELQLYKFSLCLWYLDRSAPASFSRTTQPNDLNILSQVLVRVSQHLLGLMSKYRFYFKTSRSYVEGYFDLFLAVLNVSYRISQRLNIAPKSFLGGDMRHAITTCKETQFSLFLATAEADWPNAPFSQLVAVGSTIQKEMETVRCSLCCFSLLSCIVHSCLSLLISLLSCRTTDISRRISRISSKSAFLN